MANYELLASDCWPDPGCAKVARDAAGIIAIVGPVITDPEALVALGVGPGESAVQVSEALYRAGHDGLKGHVA